MLCTKSSPIRSNRDICPDSLLFLSLAASSAMAGRAIIICFLFAPISSNAPLSIRASTVFLFVSFEGILVRKSLRSLNGPFLVLSASILSTTAPPTLFIPESPYLILPLLMENFATPSFISGGSTSTPICLHTLIYFATLPLLSITDDISADMNSTG